MKPPMSLEKRLKILELLNSPEFKKMMMNAVESSNRLIIDLLREHNEPKTKD